MEDGAKWGKAVDNCVGSANGSPLSKTKAKAIHRKAGYATYRGPKVEGPRHVVNFGDQDYPNALRCTSNPPQRLYVIGNPAALEEGLAVIGARKATPYGLGCAMRFGKAAAENGICIISGGARGCDAQAHRSALGVGGRTVAVLGGGCDHVYPREHHRLFQDIVDAGGAVVSEHEWDFPPVPYAFRERNRIIAGLAKATLIVEAGLPSGTFSTADEALAASREVLVVPGSIMSPYSAGSNQLLRQGATPIVDDESFQDALFDIFGCLRQERSASQESSKQIDDPLLAAVLASPCHREDLIRLVGDTGDLSAASILSQRLAEYEVMGFICRYPDGRYGPVVK